MKKKTLPSDPNAPLEAFDKRMDENQAWEEGLCQRTPQRSFGYCSESGVHGAGAFHYESAPSLDEIEGSTDPDSYE